MCLYHLQPISNGPELCAQLIIYYSISACIYVALEVAFLDRMVHNYRNIMTKPPNTRRLASRSRQRTRRQQALSAQGATHPRPQAVTDPLFRDSSFFDPNDLVQVKYEMLRSVQQEGRSVVEAAASSGLSRPVFYVTQELFQRDPNWHERTNASLTRSYRFGSPMSLRRPLDRTSN